MNLFLENALIITNNAKRELLEGSIRIENGRITAIGKNLKPSPKDSRVNLKGQVLIPGFVQTHVHLCQTLFRNLADELQLLDWLRTRIWPMEGSHTEKSLYASARLGIAELLAGGTTTILDMGTVRHTDAIFTAAEEMGIRAFIGKCLMDLKGGPKELQEPTQQALRENRELQARWHGQANDRLRYANAPRFALSCTPKLLREVSEFSAEKNLLIHTHANENREEITAVKALTGQENIEYLHHLGLTGERLVLAHCIWLSQKEKKLLAQTNTKVSHCPSSNLKLASGLAPVPELKKMGVCVSLGADGAPCNNNLNMFIEMRAASLLQKPGQGPTAMPAEEIFEMATLEGAKALGISADIGSIEIGKKADLVALDLQRPHSAVNYSAKNSRSLYSAIVYAANSSNITNTWVDGRLVYTGGSYPGASWQKIVQEALKEQKKLLAKIAP